MDIVAEHDTPALLDELFKMDVAITARKQKRLKQCSKLGLRMLKARASGPFFLCFYLYAAG